MNDTPIPYDEEKSKDLEMEAREILSDMHDSREPEEPIKEPGYIMECQKCGQPFFLNAKALTYEEREVFGSSWRVIKLDGKFICSICLVDILWAEGKQNFNIKKEVVVDKELIVREAIVMPAVSKEKAIEAFRAYQDLAKEIMTPDDVQRIQGKDFKKKSFWRKCQRFFNLSLEKIEERREDNNGVVSYHLTYRATAPNGTFVDGCGSCSTNEKGLLKTEHNTRAIAETRSKNRAISDLVAFGEVSAEEIVTNGHEELPPEDVIEKTLDKEKERTTELLKDNIATPVCEKCNKELTVKVYNYSMEKFNRALCFDCQKKG